MTYRLFKICRRREIIGWLLKFLFSGSIILFFQYSIKKDFMFKVYALESSSLHHVLGSWIGVGLTIVFEIIFVAQRRLHFRACSSNEGIVWSHLFVTLTGDAENVSDHFRLSESILRAATAKFLTDSVCPILAKLFRKYSLWSGCPVHFYLGGCLCSGAERSD